MANPLVAEVKDDTKAYAGVPLLESAFDLRQAIESGDWAAVAMGAVGTALDALGMALDPFGAILAAGVGWLMEHVGPLKEALDGLAGDPQEIKAHAETWKNVATELGSVGVDLGAMSQADTAAWHGVAADTYRSRTADTVSLITAAQQGADGASSGIKTAGEVVAAVRSLVRDIIAELIGHLISWALQVLFTLGIGMIWVVPQVIAAVAKVASKIADLVKRLVQALKALIPLLKRAGDLFDDAAKALKKLKSKPAGSPKPKDPPPAKGPDTPPTKKPDSNGDTSPSSAKPDPKPEPKPDPTPTPKPEPTPTPKPDSTGPSGSPGGSPGGSGKGKGDGPTGDRGAPDKPNPPRDGAQGKDDFVCESDPVDVMTGNVVVAETDLALPGTPGLALERTHISSYRAGRWFGPSWTSTVDQRLEVDDEHVCFYSDDGMVLLYPRAATSVAVLPIEGPRWPLTDTGSGYRLDDPRRERSLFFAPVRGTRPTLLPLTAVERGSQRIDVEHGAAGAPALLRHSDGRLVRLTSTRDRVTAIEVVDETTGQAVRVAGFAYDDAGRLVQVVNASGIAARYDYDADGRMTGWVDRTGMAYRYTYDPRGRCVRTSGQDGYFSGSFVYHHLTTVYTDSLGASTEYHFTAERQLSRRIDPLGNVDAYTWDRYDRLLTRTDPLGNTTSFAYDEQGGLVSVTRPDSSVLRVTDDPDGLTIEADAADGTVLSRFYPRDEAPDPFEDTLGVATPFRHEQAAAKDEQSTPVDRDLFGRPTSVHNRSQAPVVLGWTVDGQERLRVRPSGVRETHRHDAAGNEVEHVNGAGLTSRTEYGPFGLVTATTDPAGARTSQAYDTELRLVAVTNPNGLRWTYRYDAAGRLVEETDFDGRTLRFGYDRAGRLVRSSNGAGEETRYVHDALGNIVERRCPTGTTRFAYDAVGRMTAAVTADAELVVTHDADGTVLTETIDGRTLTYTYDDDGTVRRRTPSGVDSAWRFDDDGRPVSLTIAGHTVEFTHDAGGREVARSVGRDTNAGVTLTQSFDVDDNLVGQSVRPAGGQPRHRRFTYRPDGLLTGVDDDVAGPTRLMLDPAGRVVEVRTARGDETFRYDAAGNVLESRAAAPTAGTRRYADNRLVSSGNVAFDHDPQGRVVARHEGGRVWRYVWDGHDRLQAILTPDGDTWFYRYDPIGRRIAKRRVTASRTVVESYEFTWSGALLVEQVHVDASQTRHVTVWEYRPDDGRPVVQVDRSSTVDDRFLAIVTDLLGRPTELLDAAGSLVWQGNAGLWGREAGPAGTPLRFPGQYADAESGLHYNVYRYYDPSTGRYLSQDPLGLGPAPNPMAYVANPLADCDPLGLAPKCKGGGKKPDRPTGGDDAGNLPGGSKTKPSSSDTHTFGKQDNGVEVQVDSHQGKHQVGNTSFGMKYGGGKGTKFPENVNDKWHKDYFSKEVAKYTKEGDAGKIDAKVKDKQDAFDAKKQKADDLENEFKAKQDEYKYAAKEDKQRIKDEALALRDEHKKAMAEQNSAKSEFDAAKADRESYDGNKAVQYDKNPKEDGVQYDMNSYWQKDGNGDGHWVTTYHANPADKDSSGANWWKDHGRDIEKKNGLK